MTSNGAPFMSIIVPVYNVDQYLAECLESVLCQEYTEYELILVDDGSLDNSGTICDDYAVKDTRIIVIHKENGGLSDARNHGIDRASGAYILFVDSDDTMCEGSLQKINAILRENSLDILFATYAGRQFSYDNAVIQNGSAPQVIRHLFQCNHGTTVWASWRHVYRREFMQQNNLRYEKNVSGAEDCDFFIKAVSTAKVKLACSIPLIHYRIGRDNSITTTIRSSCLLGQITIFKKWFDHFNRSPLTEDTVYIRDYFAKKLFDVVATVYCMHDKHKVKEVIDLLAENRYILKYARGTKQRFARIICTIFGLSRGARVINMLNTQRKRMADAN